MTAAAHNEMRACGNPPCSNRFPIRKGPGRKRIYCRTRCRVQAHQIRKRESRKRKAPDPIRYPVPSNPIEALSDWCRDVLRIPDGHRKAGEPMALPGYARDFLADVLRDEILEAGLVISRKNAKSAVAAELVLAFLVGPLRRPGWRAGICSVSKAKARELRDQIEAIAKASELSDQLYFRASPWPGSVESETGKVEILAAEGGGGHASGFDLAIIDETGLLQERDRKLVTSMRSATSAKRGTMIHLSIHGDGPFIPELLGLRHEPTVAVHHYSAPAGCRLDDRKAWEAANPGLGTIKSRSYMAHAARLALLTPADESAFRAQELNRPGAPGRSMICSPTDWSACRSDVLPSRKGLCYLGVDLGGSDSMTAAAAYWPDTGRLEAWGALPGVPKLADRQRRDQTRYDLMVRNGELTVYPGTRVTPVGEFLRSVAERLQGDRIAAIGADRFRQAEALQAVEDAGLPWRSRMAWRGTGASKTADGSHDVRTFQKAVLGQAVQHDGGLLMASAISNSSLRFDVAGNPALDRSGPGRIDALQAAVIALGLSAVKVKRRGWRYAGRVA